MGVEGFGSTGFGHLCFYALLLIYTLPLLRNGPLEIVRLRFSLKQGQAWVHGF